MSLWLLPLTGLLGAGATVALAGGGLRRSLAPGVCAVVSLALMIALAIPAAVIGLAGESSIWGPVLHLTVAAVGIGRIMMLLVPVIAIPVVLYAIASMRDEPGLPRLLALLVAFCGAMELLVVAADVLTLLIAWELVGAASWALIGFEWRDASRPDSALNAFITTRAGDLGLYVAAGALFAATGSLAFGAISELHGPALTVVALGVLVAAAAKSAQLPFSPWLFSAMAGPTPASALLHSATMVAAGAYLLARLAPLLAPATWFGPAVAALGLTTAITGGLVALTQSDLKRALAASTSAQYGLMFVAIGAGVPAAAAAHLVMHAAFKALLFIGAGVVLHAAGTLDLSRMRLGNALPRVANLFGVGTLALAAVPPLGGAFSKEQILAASERGAGGSVWLCAGVLLAGLLSAMYAGRLQLLAFGTGGNNATFRRQSPALGIASMAILATVSILLGLLWFPGGGRMVEAVSGSSLAPGAGWLTAASLTSLAVAALLDWMLWRRGALFTFGLPDAARSAIADWVGIPVLARMIVVRPTLWLAHALAAFDGRAVDAGVRAAAGLAGVISRAFAWWTERGIDWMVSGIARLTRWTADASGSVDDRGIDASVEALAREIGTLGEESRGLQSGMTHQYYVMLSVGAVIVLIIAAVASWARTLTT